VSTITLINQTDEVVRLAVYRKPVLNPGMGTIAWRIAEPPPGGQQTLQVPFEFETYARFSLDPNDPSALDNETAHLKFSETTARFDIESPVREDRRSSVPTIVQKFTDLYLNEVRITNLYGLGCQVVVAMDGAAIYPPQVVWPGSVLVEDVRGACYVAVVAPYTTAGERLVREELELTEIEALAGSVLTVRGSQWKGYSLTAQ
jgi:hypothetical protein